MSCGTLCTSQPWHYCPYCHNVGKHDEHQPTGIADRTPVTTPGLDPVLCGCRGQHLRSAPEEAHQHLRYLGDPPHYFGAPAPTACLGLRNPVAQVHLTRQRVLPSVKTYPERPDRVPLWIEGWKSIYGMVFGA